MKSAPMSPRHHNSTRRRSIGVLPVISAACEIEVGAMRQAIAATLQLAPLSFPSVSETKETKETKEAQVPELAVDKRQQPEET